MAAATKKFTVYGKPPNANINKIIVTGKFGGVEIDYFDGFEMGKTNKTPEYLKKNPNGQIPVLDTPDGSIFETVAIVYYVARSGTDAAGLLGDTPFAQSQVDQWINFARSRLELLYPLFGFATGFGQFDQDKFNECKKKVSDACAVLAIHFDNHPNKFLLGDRITIADIVAVGSLIPPLKVSLDEEFWALYPKVKQYIANFLADPTVASVVTGVEFVPKFTPPAVQ